MGASAFASGDPRTQTEWSNASFVYALQNIALTPLMGLDKNSLIHVSKELTKRKGDTIIFDSKSPMTGAGQGDGGNTTGNEESLKRRNMSLIVHERAHSYVSDGPISEQRTSTNVREDGKEDLGSWYAEALENDLITAAAGLYNENSSGSEIQTINESYPTSSRIYYGGQTINGTLSNSGATYGTDALLTAGTTAYNYFGTKLLEKVKRLSLGAQPRFRPVNIFDLSKANPDDVRNGIQTGPLVGKYLLCLASRLQIKSVRAELGATGWAQATASAQIRGNMNPIFAGATFLWDGCIVWEYDRIPSRTGAGGTTLAEGFLLNTGRTATTDAVASGDTVDRALLMGAQALAFGWAQLMKWHEDKVDARKPKVVIDSIYGVKRTNFNAHGTETAGQDESIYCMDTQVVVD